MSCMHFKDHREHKQKKEGDSLLQVSDLFDSTSKTEVAIVCLRTRRAHLHKLIQIDTLVCLEIIA